MSLSCWKPGKVWGWLAFAGMAATTMCAQHPTRPSHHVTKFEQSTNLNCAASDATLTELRNIVCVSFAMGECCGEPVPHNVTAAGDWPNQAIYMDNLLQALVNTEVACLDTAVSRSTVEWLSDTSSATSVWWNTWMVFQVQYYDMPRKPGARIESPATLGRKCWAFDCEARPHVHCNVNGTALCTPPERAQFDSWTAGSLGVTLSRPWLRR